MSAGTMFVAPPHASLLGAAVLAENPLGGFVLTILGAVGQLERERTVERVRSGVAAALARGVKFGRPKIAEEKRAEILRLHRDGFNGHKLAVRNIAGITGVSTGTVQRVLNSPL